MIPQFINYCNRQLLPKDNVILSLMGKSEANFSSSDELKNNCLKQGKKEARIMKILVAEDNDSNYLLIKALLRGHNLVRAVNGLEALEICKSQDFDFVFMDIKMPIMDGLEATSRIREFNEDLPIFAVTANAYESDKEAAYKAGCNGFIQKPLRKSSFEMFFS